MFEQLSLTEYEDPEVESILARLMTCGIHIRTTLEGNEPCPMCDLEDHDRRARLITAHRGNQPTAVESAR